MLSLTEPDRAPGGRSSLASAGRKHIKRLFAPLHHDALVTDSQAKRQQLAGIRPRCGSVREAFAEDAFVARAAVAVVLQPRHQVGAQRLNVDTVEGVEPHQKV